MDSRERQSERLGVPIAHVIAGRSSQRGGLLAVVGVLLVLPGVIGLAAGGFGVTSMLLVGAGVIALAFAAKALWVRSRWLNPELHLPSSAPLRLGAVVTARFRRGARAAGGARGATVSAVLVCEERATYRRGTDTTTATHVAYRVEVPVTLHSGDQRVEADLHIQIPVFEAPPTMDLANNDIHWHLDVAIAAPEAPDDTSSFTLMVAPEVVV